jgi:hypothetical protein
MADVPIVAAEERSDRPSRTDARAEMVTTSASACADLF